SSFFCLHSSPPLRPLPSFPTRRSSDLDVLAAVASQASIAIQNASMHESLLERERMERDLKLAEQVQKRFLPQSVPSVPGFEFFRSEEHTSELQSQSNLVCRLLLEQKKG